MNADVLLAHYERIAGAPAAVVRLRRFVLDLAVQGKLVPQDPTDDPASAILKRILKEKTQAVKASRPGKSDIDLIVKGEEPFPVPTKWIWTRLGSIADWGSGSTPPRGNLDFYDGGITWLKSGELNDNRALSGSEETITQLAIRKCSFRINQTGDVLIAMYGATIGKVAILAEAAATNQAVCGCTPFAGIFNQFLFLFLLSQREQFRSASEGGAQPNISKIKITWTPFPLPPLAEQRRIVAKVDELMALCDRLEAARAVREATRDRLATASLARLNAPDSETFPSDARFALDALPALTTRPDQIKHLRQTILNLAVRGKLVPQNPGQEPASDLLKRIAKEKARLAKEGKAKRQDALPEIDFDQAPFQLPKGWSWGRFPEIGTFGRGKSKHRPRNDSTLFDGGQHLMIQTGDVARSQGVIETYTSKYNDFGLSQSFKWPKGTLCITIAANIADSGILSFDACFPDSVVGFIPASVFENARYFEYFVQTAKAKLLEFAPATAQKNINLEILTQVLIPLPPLAEQHRIVAKVDELMALCDALETSLTAATASRTRLLEATLRDALRPLEGTPIEAAA